MKVVIYTLVVAGTADQEGYSRHQEDLAMALCRERGFDVSEIFHEVTAGYTDPLGRPDFQRMLEMIRANDIDVVVAARVDRIARDPDEARQGIDAIRSAGGDVLFAEAAPEGPLWLGWRAEDHSDDLGTPMT